MAPGYRFSGIDDLCTGLLHLSASGRLIFIGFLTKTNWSNSPSPGVGEPPIAHIPSRPPLTPPDPVDIRDLSEHQLETSAVPTPPYLRDVQIRVHRSLCGGKEKTTLLTKRSECMGSFSYLTVLVLVTSL